MNTQPLSKTDISHAIGLSRILLIIGLVCLHYGNFPNSPQSPFQGVDIHEHQFVTWLNSTVLFFFFSAVPLLSMVSGWLFFSFPAEDAKASIKKRILRRFTSLYMPLIVWNFGYSCMLFVVYKIKPDASFFTSSNRISMPFATAGILDYINAITGLNGSPLAFQFWFVRDLFVTILVTPILWLGLRSAPYLSALILGAIWLYGYNMVIFTRPDVPFFFLLGGLICSQSIPLTVPKKTTIILFALYIILVSLRALAPYVIVAEYDHGPLWLDAGTRLMRLVGVVACWGIIYRAAKTALGKRVSVYGGLAFFLHSAHWPLLAVVKMVLWKLIPSDTDLWMVIHWWASVATTIAIGLALGLALARFFPRIFAYMNGGRLLTQ